jgi:hypothetical protein
MIQSSALLWPLRRLWAIATLAALLASCGGETTPARDGDAAGMTAATEANEPRPTMEATGANPGTGATRTARPSSRSGAATDDPTPAYLEGEWCFHREHGGGESGVVVFEADGTNRTGIVWIENEYRLEEPQDLATFRRSYPEIVEIEPDRFIGLLSASHRVVFDRAPCR